MGEKKEKKTRRRMWMGVIRREREGRNVSRLCLRGMARKEGERYRREERLKETVEWKKRGN